MKAIQRFGDINFSSRPIWYPCTNALKRNPFLLEAECLLDKEKKCVLIQTFSFKESYMFNESLKFVH